MIFLRHFLFCCLIVSLFLVQGIVSAQDWSEDFEEYDVGFGIMGSNNWDTWASNPAVDGVIVDEPAASGSKSLKIISDNDDVAKFNQVTDFAWEVKLKIYIPSGHMGATWINLMNVYAPPNFAWSNLNPKIENGTIEVGASSLSIVFDEWAEIKWLLDIDNNIGDIYYNDAPLLKGVQFAGGGVVELQAIDLYGDTGASKAFFDDLSVVKVNIPPVILGTPGNGVDMFWPDGNLPYTRDLEITGSPAPVVEVLEPAGAEISPEGNFSYTLPVDPPASFAVSIKATNDGGEATATWTVNLGSLPPEGEIAVAEELFVSLDSNNDTAGEDVWENKGTLQDFRKFGNPFLTDQGGIPAVSFAGGVSGDAYQCMSDTPAGLVGVDPTRTIEVWAYNDDIPEEETMVAWGHRGGPGGTNMAFNYGNNPYWGAVTHWGGDFADMPWKAGNVTYAPEADKWHYLVYTYDGTTTSVYVDGNISNREVLGVGAINTYPEPRIILGGQYQENAFIDNDNFVLSKQASILLSKVRIHDGVLAPQQVKHNFEAERDEFGLSNKPPSISSMPAEDFYYPGAGTYTRTLEISGIPDPAVVVLSPAEAVIRANGEFVYQLPDPEPDSFEVSIKATNSEGEADVSWTVYLVKPENLSAPPVHRYSFTDDAGDSIGDADGQTIGDVTFKDGNAVLNGNVGFTSSVPGSYIDLPNSIISDLGDHATFEVWTSWNGPIDSSWQRIFDFGSSSGGEDISDTGDMSFYIFFTPRSGSNTLRFGYNNASMGNKDERNINTTTLPADGTEHHLVITWDGENKTSVMYVDGIKVDQDSAIHMALTDLSDVNNWLGRSQYGADAMYNGKYDEFRVYNYALNPKEVLGNFNAGPDKLTISAGGISVFTGDTNSDGSVNLADAITILSYLFAGAETPPCLKSSDVNDDGSVNLADAITVLSYQFGGGSLAGPDSELLGSGTIGCKEYSEEDVTDLGCDIPCNQGAAQN